MVGFIAVDDDPIGTVFFVKISFENVLLGPVLYAVTCRHVIEGAKHHNPNGISILVNRRKETSGPISAEFGTVSVPTAAENWIFSETTDLAVCRLERDHTIDQFPYALTDSWSGHPRVGQDVFFVGMLSQLSHRNPIEAIVRTGSIAHPGIAETIYVDADEEKTVDTNVYLVESRSWGGESGSPVFVYAEHTVSSPLVDDHVASLNVVSHAQLAGIMHGHFEGDASVEDARGRIGNARVNSGIAIVLPVSDLWKLIYEHPRIMEDREVLMRQREKEIKPKPPKPDSLLPGRKAASEDVQEREFTQSDFEADLRKVSRKIVPEK